MFVHRRRNTRSNVIRISLFIRRSQRINGLLILTKVNLVIYRIKNKRHADETSDIRRKC